jgi:hypothetical protein
MFEKTIEFIAHKDYVSLKEDHPIPIKLNIPEWFKKLSHTVENKTVKGCIPFLDSLTSGYLLKIPQDLKIIHNKINPDTNQPDSFYRTVDLDDQLLHAKSINLGKQKADVHPPVQLEGSPYIEKNKNLPFFKIINPWIIKTPPGYSCLFVPPLNNADDRFSIIPAIVDTDTFPNEINFPIVINGDKYPTLDTILKKGTPYVQVIPFKRDKWKMKITDRNTEEMRKEKTFYGLTLLHTYKNKYWNKKSWN